MNIQEKAQNVYLQLETSRNMRDETQRRLNHLEQLDEYFAEYKDSSNNPGTICSLDLLTRFLII
jgi:hypothetical protein